MKIYRVLASLVLAVAILPAQSQQPSSVLDYLGIDLAKGGIQSDLSDLVPYRRMQIAGVHIEPDALPKGLKNYSELGVVMPDWIDVRVIHRFPQPDVNSGMIRRTHGRLVEPVAFVDNPRPVITPNGDYLLTILSGKGHYGGTDPHQKGNDILIYRSHDKGSTWQGPFLSTNIPYNQHAWVPLVPKGGKRIYMFSTEPAPEDFNGDENAGIGYRRSDDDGYTWSKMTRIRPINDPGFQGMWWINMTETDRGTWLLAPHKGDWNQKPLETHMYVLRSTDQGRTWELLPGKRPGGWQYKPFKRMDEGRPLSLGQGKVVLFVRTAEGHIWQLRSADDGKTWPEPAPTSLVHPDAPPMIEKLSDGKTLIALIHNRHSGGAFNRDDRSELWVSLSHDDGLSWDEPRFLAVTSTAASRHFSGTEQYCMTYCDVLADHGQLHIFIPHLWQQILEIRMSEKDLSRLPTKAQLFTRP